MNIIARILFGLVASSLVGGIAMASILGTVKVADGSLAYCQNEEHIKQGALGAYRANALSAEYSRVRHQFRFSVSIDFLICTVEAGEYQFLSQPPHAISRFVSDVTPVGDTIATVAPTAVFLQSWVDGIFEPLQDYLMGSASQQRLDLYYSVGDLLTAEQLEKLKNGETVKAAVDFWIKKNVNWSTGNDLPEQTYLNFGHSRIWYEIIPQIGSLKIKLLRLN